MTFEDIRLLQRSLYGQVRLCRDPTNDRLLAVKVSEKRRLTLRLSHTNATVLDDVHHEVKVLRHLQQGFGAQDINWQTCGLSANSQPAELADWLTDGQRALMRLEFATEDEAHHWLATEYFPSGDLLTVLQRRGGLPIPLVRHWVRQTALGILNLHARSIAHLDVSAENICIDAAGQAHIIDFAVAAGHPEQHANMQPGYLRATAGRKSDCLCHACNTVPSSKVKAAKPGSFRCDAICATIAKPGKLRYLSPELWQGATWNAYKQDTYALGVCMFIMIAGRQPYQVPVESQDDSFRDIFRGLNSAAVYHGNFTPQTIDLIRKLICPPRNRLTIDQVLQHPFLAEDVAFQLHNFHPLEQPASSPKKRVRESADTRAEDVSTAKKTKPVVALE